ncbi:hypothetical protein RHMOL_Rhmol06G0162700 [Rhododendron molle]|uniref:Uncharacterized protein n=1 Tax=Rhododendron molle TaxID=49168 RepID=A0ACC0ND19_RHOML|nr:hypothetical protein RHMOL_Rhmol06G0162700 [Rhododendron molle]
MNHSTGRLALYAQQMPRAKETLSKLAVPLVSSQIKSDFGAISGPVYATHYEVFEYISPIRLRGFKFVSDAEP